MERVGRRRFVTTVVGLVEGRAVVLGRRGPWITTRVVGYSRRIVHDGWFERTDWSLDMQVLDGLAGWHLLETMTSALPQTGTCQEPRAANIP